MPNWKKVVVSGSDATLNSLNLTSTGSGQTVLDIQGSQGQLFSITDDLTGDIFSISDISGVPIFNINASGATTFDGYVPDNSKLKFGNSEDLEIYHDGSDSYIKDVGTGVLNISSNQLNLNASNGENAIQINENADVKIRHNNVVKFATTSTGVTVTGNTTLSGFVLDGNTITGINDSGEFDDNDSHIMTSAGVNDRIQTIPSIYNTSLQIGGASNANHIGFSAGKIAFTAGNEHQFNLTDGAIRPATDNNLDLGTSALRFKNIYAYDLILNGLPGQSSEATSLMIDSSGNVGTRELGSNAFNSNTYNNYALPAGSSSVRGGFKIGYTENSKNYPVEVSSEKMYVNVPWSDTNTNTQLSAAQVRANFSGGTNVSINSSGVISSTDTNTNTVTSFRRDNTGTYRTGNINLVGGTNVSISEGSAGVFTITSTDTNTDTNTQLSTSQVRSKISASGNSQYNASTGVITSTNTNTQLSDAQVRSKFSAGSNVSISASGVISSTDTNTDTNTFRGIRVDTTGNGDANNTLGATETLMLKKGNNISLSESSGVITISSTDTNTNTQLSTSQVRSKISGTGLISYNNSTGVISTTANNITNNNQISNGAGYRTAAQVNTAIAAVVDSAPEALDTLKEIATSLENDADFAGTMTTALSGKLSTSGKAADSNLLDGLDLHTGRNNQANKVVRTNSSGYADFGWINTTSGATTSTINRVYCSADGYIRYMTPTNFRNQIISAGTNVAISSTGVISATDTNTDTNTQLSTAQVRSKFSGNAINTSTGVITNTDTNTQLSDAQVRSKFSAGTNVAISDSGVISSTDTNTDTNTQLSTSQVRSKISGTGLISYNNSTGVISTTANNITNNNQISNGASYLTTSGKAADSEKVDGINGASLLRSDTADTFTGTLTMGTQNALVANNYGRGVFGLYSASRYQHVWSMGTAYNLADNGTTPGDMYGLAFTHTNNTQGQAKSGLSHQLLIMNNGVTKSAIGTGIWTSGLITTTSYGTSDNWKTAYSWGDHSTEGYVKSSGNTIIGTDTDINTSGATVIDQLNMTDGVIQSHSTRTLTLGNLGYTGATNANNFTYTLPAGSSSVRGGFKIGYTENSKNYPVEVSSEKMYVNVPWSDTNTDTNTQLSTAQVRSKISASGNSQYNAETGVITSTNTNTQLSDAQVRAKFSAGSNVSISASGVISSTDTNTDTNTQLTTAQVRGKFSGTGINTSTGVITNTDTNTQLSDAQVRSKFSAGTNVQISDSGVISSTDTNTDTNTQLSTAQVRAKFSGNAINTSTGVITNTDTNTQLSDAQVRSKFSAGSNVSISSSGVISSTDTNTDTNTFRGVRAANGESVSSLTASETLTISAGSNVSVSESAGTITINATDTNTDTNTQLSTAQVRSKISASGNSQYNASTGVITSTNTNTTYNAGGGLSLSGTTFSNTGVLSLVAGSNVSLTASTGIITVSSTNTNTTYSADGNYGITLSGTTFRLENDRRRNSSSTDVYTGNTHDYVFFDASHGMRFYTAGSEDMRLDNSGNLHVDADVVAFSTTVSDERLKDNVTTIENPLDKIKALRGVEYDWNSGNRKGKHDLGLIAQEVEKVLPNIVHEHEMPFLNDDEEDETLYKTVDYEKMVAVLIEGMKEQQNQIDSLKSELTEIKGKL